ETRKEMPLEHVEGQGYIHYRKGSLVMYALQDYVGEDSVNAALQRYCRDWAFREDRYVTSDILVNYFREITPDSLRYLIEDMFETITLYENRAKKVEYSELDNGQYQVELELEAVKYRADSLGVETAVSMQDWMDVGIYTEGKDGKDSLVYMQKHKFAFDNPPADARGKTFNLSITVDAKPTKAGIDPINKLIDRNPEDNRKEAVKKEGA
ncbi:MAG: aminopeptidase, partial [Bacteroidota bacterium]